MSASLIDECARTAEWVVKALDAQKKANEQVIAAVRAAEQAKARLAQSSLACPMEIGGHAPKFNDGRQVDAADMRGNL